MAPSSVVSMFLAPVAGKLSDRIGGKFILMGGLTLYAIGMLWLVLVAEVGTSWTAFIPALVVAGFGIGGVFAPMATEATRNVPPRLAGAASGVNNTVRQIGSVLGSAAVGAVLQNQLASSLKDEAATRAAALPPDVRPGFVKGFAGAAKGGLEVGAGQTGTQQKLPPGVPQSVVHQVQQVAGQVFSHGFVHAMKPTMWLPIGVILLSAAACLSLKGHNSSTALAQADPEPAPMAT
jgi:MFS family permease